MPEWCSDGIDATRVVIEIDPRWFAIGSVVTFILAFIGTYALRTTNAINFVAMMYVLAFGAWVYVCGIPSAGVSWVTDDTLVALTVWALTSIPLFCGLVVGVVGAMLLPRDNQQKVEGESIEQPKEVQS